MVFEFGPPENPRKYRLIKNEGLFLSQDSTNVGLGFTALSVLAKLVEARGRILQPGSMVPDDFSGDDKTFAYTYVHQIRDKLGKNAIAGVNRIGYSFNWDVAGIPQDHPSDVLKYREAVLLIQRRIDPFISKAISMLLDLPDSFTGKYEALVMAHICRAGYVSGDRGDVDAAVRYGHRAVEFSLRSWHAHASLGLAQSCLLEWADAKKSFDRANHLDPAALNRSLEYGIYRVSRGQHDPVLKAWKELLVAKPPPPSELEHFLLQTMFQIHYMKGDYNACRSVVETSAEMLAQSWIPLAVRGVLAMDEGNRRAAISFFERARKIAGLDGQQNSVEKGLELGVRLMAASQDGGQLDGFRSPDLVADMLVMFAHAGLDRADDVLAILRRLVESRCPFLCWFLQFPCIRKLSESHTGLGAFMAGYPWLISKGDGRVA